MPPKRGQALPPQGERLGNGPDRALQEYQDQLALLEHHKQKLILDIAKRREDLREKGYFLIRGFLEEPHKSSVRRPEKIGLRELQLASKDTAALARTGAWPFIRTLPKQFPPWSSDTSQGIWGVQHLIHPDLPESKKFAQSYFSLEIARIVSQTIDCSEDELVMELYNLLITPDEDFALRLHRDDITPAATAEEEQRELDQPVLHAQWNLALYDDASLIVVPGSHRRPRTDAERQADPYVDNMPGQEVIKMKAGDIVFYNNNILHRGVYSSKVERMTLHGSMGTKSGDPARARNVLQHGVGEWVHRCDFSGLYEDLDGQIIDWTLSSRAELMKANLVSLAATGPVAFSQPDE